MLVEKREFPLLRAAVKNAGAAKKCPHVSKISTPVTNQPNLSKRHATPHPSHDIQETGFQGDGYPWQSSGDICVLRKSQTEHSTSFLDLFILTYWSKV